MSTKRLLTGLQPSGNLHIGNYFAALKPFLEMHEGYECYLMIADYHALTTTRDAQTLRQNIEKVALDYLAVGIDPKQVLMFKQSDVPAHTELAWIFECLVSVPFLQQAHAYKDKIAKGLEANVGLFNYPMLMAADILLYDIDVVPVGEDQRQHIEYAREAAAKFNNAYGETFTPPQEKIIEGVGTIPGTDGHKMSKSYKNTIPLFGSRDEIQKTVMGIVTDSSGTRPENVYAIHRLFKSETELEPLYAENEGNYKALKEALVEDIDAHIAPLRERRKAYASEPEKLKSIIAEGGDKARALAEHKIKEVREKVGITL